MLYFRDQTLGALVGLMFAPFGLQLLGWAGTPLGGGPCGVFGQGRLMLEQPQAFFYAQVMLWGISLLLAVGFFMLMLSFMHSGSVPSSQARPFVQVGQAIGGITALVYLLTRTTGLPTPSPIGWLLSNPEPFDTIGVLVLLVLLTHNLLALCWLSKANVSQLLGPGNSQQVKQ